MGVTNTTNYSLIKPNPGEERDAWGPYVNSNMDTIDTQLKSLSDSKAEKGSTNTFTADQVISVNSSGSALRITQTGAGNALVVEDSANPDATPLVVDPAGRLIVGGSASLPVGEQWPLQVQATVSAGGVVALFSNNTSGASFTLLKSRSTTVGSYGTIVQNGDEMGVLRFAADDGVDRTIGATIYARVDGTPGVGDMPTRLLFGTTPDGGSAPVERFRINSSGAFGIGGANFGTSGQVLISGGSSASPSWGTLGLAGGGTGATDAAGARTSLGAAGTGVTNTFTADQVISVNSSSNALRITQTGAGNALVVEDSSNPDATPFVVDATGDVVIGHTASIAGDRLSVLSGHSATFTYTNNSASYGQRFFKSRSTTPGSFSILSGGDEFGQLRFLGDDGASFVTGATIYSQVDGTPGAGSMPGRIIFATTPSGASVAAERLRINSSGAFGIGGANFGTSGQALISGGSAAAPSWGTLGLAGGGTGATDAASARTNLGLGSMATQAANSVSITGGSISGITDLAIADGGTGASTAAGARTNLGLGALATLNTVGTTEIADNSVTGAKIALGSDAQGDVMFYNGTDWARLGAGTAGQLLRTNGAAANPEWASAITRATAVASTSGTNIDFGSIPSWARKITIMLSGVSTNSSDPLLVQLGDAGGIETTGYSGTTMAISSGGQSISTNTSGILLSLGADSSSTTRNGNIVLRNLSGNVWTADGGIGSPELTRNCSVFYSKTLSDVLTQLRVTTLNGTATFDAGTINIMYE